MNFKYKSIFSAQGGIVTNKATQKEAIASLSSNASSLDGLKGLLPSKEQIDKNPDLLFFTANLAVANKINLNGDGVTGAEMINLSKTALFKQINIEHSRENGFVGCIVSAGFSEFGTNKILTEKEVMEISGPFNLTITGALWKLAGDIWEIIEDSSLPSSANFGDVSISWEIGFSEFHIADNEDLSVANIISGDDAEAYSQFLRSEGGPGFTKSGRPCYRVPVKATTLGLGLVLSPAADVKGLITPGSFAADSDMEMEMKEPDMEMDDSEMEDPEMEMEEPEMEEPEEESPEMEDDDEEGKKMVKIELEIEVSAAEKVLNKPFRLPSGSKKKFGVYVKNDKGNVVTVKFGDPNMEIKRDDPDRRKAYRSRHGCDVNPGPKWKANYWSCKMWSGEPVSEIVASVEEEMMDLKEDLAEMVLGSISSIQKHAETILTYANDPVVKENLSEPFLQGMAALAEDYVSSIHDYVIYSQEPSEMEDEEDMEKIEAAKKGLWENIRDKKKKMGKNYKPAKPGSDDYPDKDAYKKAQGDDYEWDGEKEFSQAELLRIDPTLANAEELEESYAGKNIKKSENKISSSNKPIVTPINQPMKITDLKSAIAAIEGVDSEAFASKAVCDFITSEIAKANELYVAEQTLKAESEASLAAALSDATEAKAKFEELSARLAEVEVQAAAQAAQDIFDARFNSLSEVYNVEDPKLRSLIAKQIRDLDEAAFESWKQEDGLVILAGKEKEKTPVNIEQATELMKEAKASVEDLPNAQDLADKPKFNILDLSDLIEIKA
jgi:hypothetical protein